MEYFGITVEMGERYRKITGKIRTWVGNGSLWVSKWMALQSDEFVMTSMRLYSIRQSYNDKVNFYVCCRLALSVMFHACIKEVLITSELSKVGSRFTTGLRSRIFGCKSNRRKTSII